MLYSTSIFVKVCLLKQFLYLRTKTKVKRYAICSLFQNLKLMTVKKLKKLSFTMLFKYCSLNRIHYFKQVAVINSIDAFKQFYQLIYYIPKIEKNQS